MFDAYVALILMPMAPQRTVGIRELRNNLNRLVDEVTGGVEILVTVRGTPVARMNPVDRPDPLAELRRKGLVQEPTRAKRELTRADRVHSKGSVSDLVGEQRR